MDSLDLNTLGLAKKWPKLTKLQSEVADLQKRLAAAEQQVRLLENQIGAAREKDLVAAAEALRRDKDVPAGVHEDSAKRALEAAERDRDILAKATEAAQADLAAFRTAHQGALYEDVAGDVAGARAEIARGVAQAASEALRGYSRHEDLAYVLKGLQPPVEVPDWTGPPNPNSVSVIGVATRGPQGPARGDVEGMLQYLISLAAPAAPEAPAPGDSDAAA